MSDRGEGGRDDLRPPGTMRMLLLCDSYTVNVVVRWSVVEIDGIEDEHWADEVEAVRFWRTKKR